MRRWFASIAAVCICALNAWAEQGIGTSSLFTVDTRWGFSEGAAVSGLIRIDTRFSGSTGEGASGLFTVDTIGANVGHAMFAGYVTETGGASLAGATVSALQNNVVRAQVGTDTSGYYQLNSLPAGIYEVRAAKPGYVSGVRLFQNLAPGETRIIHYLLKVLPAPPPTVPATQVPPPTPLPPTPDQLKVWLGGTWQNIALDRSKMTIVLTHGMLVSFEGWPTVMAQRLSSAPGNIPSVANIVAWDWENDAAGLNLNRSYSRTPAQGEALAQALHQSLGVNYAKQLHFIGHSLGSLVNAKAADYLHVNAYPYQRTHMTLLDNAVLANVGGPLEEAAISGAMQGSSAATISLAISTSRLLQRGWVSPIPAHAGWIDNYISLVGISDSRAVNILLANGPIFASSYGLIGLHGYSYDWYGDTVLAPASSLLGHRYSFERQTEFTDSSPYAANSFFVQNDSLNGTSLRKLNTAEEIDNFQALLLGTVGRVTVTEVTAAVQGAVRTVGNVVVKTVEVTQNAYQNAINAVSVNSLLVGPGFLFGGLDSINAASLRWELIKTPSPPSGATQVSDVQAAGGESMNESAYVWMTVAVPSNAVSMSFDFELHGDGKDDTLVFGIDNTNQFALETRFIPPDIKQNSGSLDVRQWAGTNVEFFFGFAGGTSTNAMLAVEGIRFYAELPPTLEVEINGNRLVMKWPVGAGDYLLESATELGTTNAWIALTNIPALVEFRNVVTNSITDGGRFYRLKK